MPQNLNFKNLYTKSREEITETLVSMWTGGTTGSNGYEDDMANAVREMFAPQNPMPIVVQSMFTWKHMDNIDSLPKGEEKERAISDAIENARTLVDWNKTYAPFKHQYESWDALLNQNKSICVTTGTGSGKTECFMLPIIKKIAEHRGQGVRAIFLYPLNALAEDQKSRLEEYLQQVDPNNEIKFAVYNGNTPESRTDNDTLNDGTLGSTNKGEAYAHELKTRQEIRDTPPAILVTNPTMLEYIMLRDKDANLLSNSLEWFVIDETHTFKGAAAAELAMLIRRVLLACDLRATKQVMFATSSATTGTGGEEELKKFIADISWREPDDIKAIKGDRIIEEGKLRLQDNLEVRIDDEHVISLSAARQQEIANSLLHADFISLDELITEGETAEDKLACLDKLCEEVGVMAKALYFFQAPSQGLSTQLDALTAEGRFQILNKHKNDECKAPYVELVRCKKCGAILAQAQVEASTDVEDEQSDDVREYKRRKIEKIESFDIVSDLDDLQDDEEDGSSTDGETTERKNYKTWLFAPAEDGDGTCYAVLNKLHLVPNDSHTLNLKHSQDMTCPCCNKAIIKVSDTETNEAHDDGDAETTYLLPLRVSSLFLSRTLSRTFLEQMTEAENKTATTPHNGQQFISFVDNRQGAAKLTLDQAKDIEEQWLQSRVFKILSEPKQLPANEEREYRFLSTADATTLTADDVERLKELEEKKAQNFLLWKELFNRLYQDYKLEISQLVKQSLTKREQEENNSSDIIRYVMTLMYEQLGSRKPKKDSLETFGMVRTYYPALEELNWDEIAEREPLKSFNEIYCGNRITADDWKDFVYIYFDYQLRTDASVYFNGRVYGPNIDDPWHKISITRFRRFATKQDMRRPAQPLKTTGRFGKLLCMAAGWNDLKAYRGSFSNLNSEQNDAIKAVLSDVFYLLTEDKNILENEPPYINGKGKWDNEDEDTWRLNLDKIAFKIYDRAYLCPVKKRIIPYTFMGYSPYMDNIPQKAIPIQSWDTYDFSCDSTDTVKQWCATHRNELGNISNRSARMFLPNLNVFVSAEHTAQVDKGLLEEHQKEFKKHDINILTCSTTMEMGVDLGSLELVVMNSIPPHPANYKQRAGRSGRSSQNKSAAITFCGNDSLGKLTLADSMHNLIARDYSVPKVDFDSPQIIQRHVNSYLLRLCMNDPLGEKVCNLFAEQGFDFRAYEYDRRSHLFIEALYIDDSFHTPTRKLGDTQRSIYAQILNNLRNQNWTNQVDDLLRNTPFEGDAMRFIADAISMLEDVRKELSIKVDNIANMWEAFFTENRLTDNISLLDGYKRGKYPRLIYHKYVDLLREPLVNYLSTHQYTPNAAMPVCIVEFDCQDEDNWSRKRRPSYTLNRALSQYAPGKLVVLNNVCYRSAGVDWKNRFSNAGSGFKQIVEHSSGEVEILEGVNNPNEFMRSYNMISPRSFCTDINVDDNRISDGDIYTRTEAHLINVGAWGSSTSSKLIQSRGPEKGRTPEILFINTGKNGMGFCVCTKCGRSEIETDWALNNGQPVPPPPSFLYSNDNDGNTANIQDTCHLHISKKKENCANDNLMRNVVFGDTIQTDYCELKLFNISVTNNSLAVPFEVIKGNVDFQILHTLGMLLCNDLSKYEGIERGEIDYLITSIGTLCIYDLAKGGAGYSKRLLDYDFLFKCLNRIRDLLNKTNEHGERKFTTDQMIDSFTVFNEDYINLDSTREWLNQEFDNRLQVPDVINQLDGQASFCEDLKERIIDAIRERTHITLFANWLSVTEDNFVSFKERNRAIWFKECTEDNTDICFYSHSNRYSPSNSLLNRIKASANLRASENKNIVDGVYPIAIIGNQFFVTDNVNMAQFDENWGTYPIYAINANENTFQSVELELRESAPNNLNKFILEKGIDIHASQILDTIEEKDDNGIIQDFFERHQGEEVDIVYEDQYLLSPFALSIAVQVIKSVIAKFPTSNHSVFIEMEKFNNPGRTGSMMLNLRDEEERDYFLENLCNGLDWGEFYESYDEKSLPHWRVLEITAGDETLEIYPNGGFANGWYFSSHGHPYYSAATLSHTDDMQIELQEDIMFDVQLIKHDE